MKRELTGRLRCPVCRGEVKLDAFAVDSVTGEIEEGIVRCDGHWYPVTKGIPRMLPFAFELFPDFTSKFREPLDRLGFGTRTQERAGGGEARAARIVREQFERQWRWWGSQTRLYGRTQETMTNMVREGYAVPDIKGDLLAGKVILDAGCGHGGFTKAFSDAGAIVVGLEYGLGVDRAKERCTGGDHVHFVQGDIFSLPFAPATFDVVFCHGVLPFLQDPYAGFQRLVESTKPGGYIRIWMYPKRGLVWEWLQNGLRALLSRLPPRLLYYLCFIPVPILRYVETYSGTHLGNSSWKECSQVVWDYYSSPTQSHHTEQEIIEWYQSCNCDDVKHVHVPLSLVGRKRRA